MFYKLWNEIKKIRCNSIEMLMLNIKVEKYDINIKVVNKEDLDVYLKK